VGRRQLARLGAPVAFLLAVTIAVLLVRSAVNRGPGAGSPTTLGPVGTFSTPTQASTTGKRPTGSVEHRYYTVQKGDTFGSIAARLRTTVARLEALNPKVNPTALQVGQKIRTK
jgi:LysM repeat protein